MHYFHRDNMTRSKRVGLGIVAFEILILVLALLFSRLEANGAESAAQLPSYEMSNESNVVEQSVYSPVEVNLKTVSFYVDDLNRIFIGDDTVVHRFGHLVGCPLNIVSLQNDYYDAGRGESTFIPISIADAQSGVTIQTAKYTILVLGDAVVLRTVDHGVYRFEQDCN